MRVVQISDLHLKEFSAFEKSVAKKVNDLQPDILVMTGDYIESGDEVDDLKKFLGLLPSNCPKFAVLGNWDHWSGVKVKDFNQMFSRLRINLLDNSKVSLKPELGSICIIGVDDPTNGWQRLEKAAGNLSDKNFNLFLAHSPNIISDIKNLPIDLMLCGHTHGGQVRIPGIKPFWLPRKAEGYVSGFYQKNGKTMYVNRGIGTSVMPVSFLCRPEITAFNMQAKDQSG